MRASRDTVTTEKNRSLMKIQLSGIENIHQKILSVLPDHFMEMHLFQRRQWQVFTWL